MRPTSPGGFLAAVAGVMLFSMALTLLPSGGQAAPKPGQQEVLVVNPASEPVPTTIQGTVGVTGNVSVVGTPSVSIAGTPAVELADGSSVQIGNSSANPVLTRDVDRTGQAPIDVTLIVNAPDSLGEYSVPSGQRLAIRSVSALCDGSIHWFRIQTSIGGSSVQHYYASGSVTTESVMNAHTLAFADGGTTLAFVIGGISYTQCHLNFTGYLQPM